MQFLVVNEYGAELSSHYSPVPFDVFMLMDIWFFLMPQTLFLYVQYHLVIQQRG
jgi:hypothetical protein